MKANSTDWLLCDAVHMQEPVHKGEVEEGDGGYPAWPLCHQFSSVSTPPRTEIKNRVTSRLDSALAWSRDYAKALPTKQINRSAKWIQEDIDVFDALSRRKYALKKVNHQKRRSVEVQATGSFTADEWNALVIQYEGKCAYCHRVKRLTIDHVMPLSKGGSNDISNIVPACKSCNSRKGARTT